MGGDDEPPGPAPPDPYRRRSARIENIANRPPLLPPVALVALVVAPQTIPRAQPRPRRPNPRTSRCS